MPSAYQVNQIISSIEREIDLHQKYLVLVGQEQDTVTHLQLQDCEAIGKKRGELCDQIAAEREKRARLLLAVGGADAPARLSDFARALFSPIDQRRILPLIERLRSLVKRVQRESQEFSQVLNFSLGMVSSTLSIIRSASQEVQKSYTGQGLIRESYHPAGDRYSATLRQA